MNRKGPYLFYRAAALARIWLTRRITGAGMLAGAALIVTSVFGLDTNLTMAFQIFTFLAVLLVLALAIRFLHRPYGISAERNLPKFATVGEPFEYRVTIQNDSNKKMSGLSVYEDLESRLPLFQEYQHISEPGEARRNAFDRYFGYYRWSWLKRQPERIQLAAHPSPEIAKGARIDLKVGMTPIRRGRLDFCGLSLARTEPMGLFRFVRKNPAPGTVMVLPKRYPAPPAKLSGNRKYQPGGVALASNVGDSEEFVSLRDYRPGDPLRKIHWKSWAKRDKPIVKEHQDEFFVRHALVLDTFQAFGSAELFEEAVSVAASFAASVLTQESLLDLMFIGPEAYCFTSGRGLAHTDRMLEILSCVAVCRDKSFSALPPIVMKRASLLSACIVVLLDWDEERREFIQSLKALDLPVKVLVISEQAEPALEPGPMADDPANFHQLIVGEVEKGLAGA